MTDKPVPRLRIVETGGLRREREPWRCVKCAEAGRDSGALLPVVLEADLVGREIVPGETGFACMTCFAKGIVSLV